MENPHRPNGTHKLVHYWPVIVAIVITILGYGTLQNRVAVAEDKIEKAEVAQEQQRGQAQQTAVGVAEVKTEVKAVKEQLRDVNAKLDRLLERR